MEIPFRELQHCNTATASAEPNLFELCRAPTVSATPTLQQREQNQTCLSFAERLQCRQRQRCNSECRVGACFSSAERSIVTARAKHR